MPSFSIQIPSPCHERWSEMPVAEQGRFCASCQKLVVDYTALSDRELISVLSKPLATDCGRFRDDQLNRRLVPVKPGLAPLWRHWVSLLTVSLFGWQTARAQTNQGGHAAPQTATQPADGKPTVSVEPLPIRSAAGSPPKWVVNGRVMLQDSGGNRSPVPQANILIVRSGESWSTYTDDTGAFSIPIATRVDTTPFAVYVQALDHLRAKTTFQTPPTDTVQLDDILLYPLAKARPTAITGGGIVLIKSPSLWQRIKRKQRH